MSVNVLRFIVLAIIIFLVFVPYKMERWNEMVTPNTGTLILAAIIIVLALFIGSGKSGLLKIARFVIIFVVTVNVIRIMFVPQVAESFDRLAAATKSATPSPRSSSMFHPDPYTGPVTPSTFRTLPSHEEPETAALVMKTFARKPKPSASWYGAVARANSLVTPPG